MVWSNPIQRRRLISVVLVSGVMGYLECCVGIFGEPVCGLGFVTLGELVWGVIG